MDTMKKENAVNSSMHTWTEIGCQTFLLASFIADLIPDKINLSKTVS